LKTIGLVGCVCEPADTLVQPQWIPLQWHWPALWVLPRPWPVLPWKWQST